MPQQFEQRWGLGFEVEESLEIGSLLLFLMITLIRSWRTLGLKVLNFHRKMDEVFGFRSPFGPSLVRLCKTPQG
jgi:hypothetical protein